MGLKQVVVDDLTGRELDEPVNPTTVRVDGDDYDVYLSAQSKETFVAFLRGEEPLRKTVSLSSRKRTAASPVAKEDRTAMREWLRANGYKVGDRGNIKQELRDAYNSKTPAKK